LTTRIRCTALLAAVTLSLIGVAPLGATTGAAQPLLTRMIGTWTVAQRMWPAPGAVAVALPRATAKRRLIGNAFLQEEMTQASGAVGAAFTRVAYLNYNSINSTWEYVSLDTRAPQVMNERGSASNATGALNLNGDRFVAAQWGPHKNAAFRYRLVVGPVRSDRQDVSLFLTPLSFAPAKEFRAFEYVYTRAR
jgi:hypothetical protein